MLLYYEIYLYSCQYLSMTIKVKYNYWSKSFWLHSNAHSHIQSSGLIWLMISRKVSLKSKMCKPRGNFPYKNWENWGWLCVQVKPAQRYRYSVMHKILLSLLHFNYYLISNLTVLVNV